MTSTGDSGVPEDPDKLMFEKFGLRGEDMTIYLGQCGLSDGQEEELPAWKARMAAKYLSEGGSSTLLPFRTGVSLLCTVQL